ncbi:MAG: hypothetical protein Q7U04_10835, partial [Bacteriovorax sp.]|nr:hypothetical protein [Bacteriovorax sp.]
TWLCREIEDKSGIPGKFWEDVELPQWATNELMTKKVELIFPYFDGVDRMGMALVFFPAGLNPKIERSLSVTLEMARTVFLDSIQRKIVLSEVPVIEEAPAEKKKLSNLFSGLFNRNKAG